MSNFNRQKSNKNNVVLTETQRVPNGVAHAPGSRYDVQQRGVVAGRFPLDQHHQQARVERKPDHWNTSTSVNVVWNTYASFNVFTYVYTVFHIIPNSFSDYFTDPPLNRSTHNANTDPTFSPSYLSFSVDYRTIFIITLS